MYHAIVVGARCAGAATALLLARKGYRVLLLDRASFPSDTISSHFIHPPGVARLAAWGLLDRLAATGCPPIHTYTFDLGEFALSGPAHAAGPSWPAYAPRRTVLDRLLVEAAVEAGAELREGVNVTDLCWDGDRVVGVVGRTRTGTRFVEGARIVVGADGRHSSVARRVQAPRYHAHPTLTCNYYAYWDGVPVAGAELHQRDRRFLVAVPTHDALTLVAVIAPIRDLSHFQWDLAAHYHEALDLAPGLRDRVRLGRQVEPFRGMASLPNFFRRAHGPGWALVGDAGHHKDPITAQGMSDAFRDAELLAAGLDDAFAGRRPITEALADYEWRRDEASLPMYRFTLGLARLEPPPEAMRQLFAALRHDPVAASRFLGAAAGTVPISEFFAPDNLERIVGSAPTAVTGPVEGT
ncbi:MAG TPA: NAD(P)/FAD-dependent oxidoreductase [Gemmatimonadales bacterium]|nr:NAD(P)/FAD-dependent oxidoreductase [Gemmatimonadales bacterium]